MTENMAARGEGLAGLRELDSISDLLHEHAVGLRSTNALRAREIGVLASRLDRAQVKLEIALEAAAPAGTAPTWDDAYAAGVKLRDSMRERVAALATPSPQAPATTPVDEPKNDDRAYGCYTCGKQGLKKGQRVSLVYCNECDAKHIEEVRRAAATQEQPAGSRASEQLLQDFNAQFGFGIFVVTGEHQRTAFFSKEKAEHYLAQQHDQERFRIVVYPKPDPGSPRKVGEDGPSAQEIRLGVHLQHCNFGEYPNACKYGDDDCPALTESWSWFGKALERAARSSSVPVGEQKQEEGV